MYLSDFEGTADVDNIEVQWLSKAIPRKVEFFVDGSLVEAGTLRDSSVGWTDIYSTYELNQKNCSKIVMKMSESTGSFSTDGLTVRLGIRRIKGMQPVTIFAAKVLLRKTVSLLIEAYPKLLEFE